MHTANTASVFHVFDAGWVASDDPNAPLPSNVAALAPGWYVWRHTDADPIGPFASESAALANA